MQMAGYMNFGENISDITGFTQNGREFAVVGLINEAAAFVDITNPYNPIEVGRISGSPRIHRDLKYWKRHVYIGTEANDGIKVVSVDNPYNPVLVYTITDFGSSHNIHIDSTGYLYVIGAEEHDIWIYELTDHPETPQFVGSWDGEYLHDIEVYNSKIYGAAIGSGKIYIIDVSDKSNPNTIISFDTQGISTHDCAVTEDEQTLITADETPGGHIKIWDISDYDNINLVSEYMTHPEHSVHNVYVRPGTNMVIMSYYVDGTRVLDISDPDNPIEVGYFDTSDLTGLYDGNWGTYAYLPSGYIISSDRQNGLFIFSSPLTDSSMVWSDCEGITGDDATCFGETYQIESGILEEIINLNPELEGIIPEEIGKFIMGRVIDIDLSKRGLITLSLPDNFGSLVSLSSLQLQENQLTALPEQITNSHNISILNVSGNQLSDIPVGIENLQRLNRLDISNNHFTNIPESILTVNSLIELDISENQLTTLPENIGELTNLGTLNLKGNNITSLSPTLCELPDDCMIDITGNHLCSEMLDSAEECITTISYQYCGECESGFMLDNFCSNPTDVNVLQAIIDSNDSLNGQHPLILGHSTQYSTWNNGNLEYLDLSFHGISVLPENMGDLDFLKELNLKNNSVEMLPESFSQMDNLLILKLHNNMLSSLPEDIGNLENLEELFLPGNQLTSISYSIGELQNLQKLYLQQNLLTSLPSTICDLPQDCTIRIDDNCIAENYDCIPDAGDQNECSSMNLINAQPADYQLFAPHPNPFNPVIAIEYSLSYTSKIKLTIYDLLGRQVEILYIGKQYLGNYTISWDASNYSSGVYFIKMNVGDSQSPISQSRKVVLLK